MLDEAFARGWENLVGRWGGPMSFRFLIQPAVAIEMGWARETIR